MSTYGILTSVGSDLVKESYLEEFRERAESRREPLMLSLVSGKYFSSPRFLVPNKVQPFQRTTLNTAVSTTTNTPTSLTLDNLAVFPVDIRKNEILKIDSEYFVVTAEPVVSTSTIVCQVTRGSGNQFASTAATHAASSTVIIMGRLNAEGSKYDRSSHVTGTRREAYTQIFKWEFEQTTTAAGIDGQTVGDDNNAAAQIDKGINRLYNEVQIAMFKSKKSGSSTVTNTSTSIVDSRTLSGLDYWHSTYNGISVAAGSAQINPDMFDSVIETIVKRGGGANAETGLALGTGSTLVCVMNETQRTFVNRFLNPQKRVDNLESTLRNYVGTYESSMARVDFIGAPEETCLPSEAYFYDPKDVIVAALTGGDVKEIDIAIDGDTAVKKMLRCEMGCAVVNPETVGKITGLATS